jgi:hypothetical protein
MGYVHMCSINDKHLRYIFLLLPRIKIKTCQQVLLCNGDLFKNIIYCCQILFDKVLRKRWKSRNNKCKTYIMHTEKGKPAHSISGTFGMLLVTCTLPNFYMVTEISLSFYVFNLINELHKRLNVYITKGHHSVLRVTLVHLYRECLVRIGFVPLIIGIHRSKICVPRDFVSVPFFFCIHTT